MEELDRKNVALRILDFGGSSVDTKSPSGRLMLTMFAAMGQFEREVMLQRQLEGIAAAKAVGKYRGRAATARAKSDRVVAMWTEGVGASDIAKALGIGCASVYRMLPLRAKPLAQSQFRFGYAPHLGRSGRRCGGCRKQALLYPWPTARLGWVIVCLPHDLRNAPSKPSRLLFFQGHDQLFGKWMDQVREHRAITRLNECLDRHAGDKRRALWHSCQLFIWYDDTSGVE